MKNIYSTTQEQDQLLDTRIAPRMLKVVEVGDFWAKRTMPSIRLQGKWMQRAGILPNRHVRITNPEPGVLLIRLQETPISDQNHLNQTHQQILKEE